MVPFGYYNKTMKTTKIILMLLLSFILAGCGKQEPDKRQEQDVNVMYSEMQDAQDNIVFMEDDTPVRIGVIDTGFSSDAIPGESVLEGWNYLEDNVFTEDTYGHGTAVASVILAHNPRVLLVPLVSSAHEKGKIVQVESDVFAQIIRDAVDVYQCDIINISAGLSLDMDEIREAISYAEEKQVLVVASGGNDYKQNGAVIYYPAAYESVVAVGSLTRDGKAVSDFSQRGEWIDLYMIGEEVLVRTLSGKERREKGTSYSVAKVSAMAAKLLQEKSDISAEELRRELEALSYLLEEGIYVLPESTDRN